MASFGSYALSKQMIEALNALGYHEPTPIQQAVLPPALRGESLVATAETGSGKTHAFLIPILERIDYQRSEVQALIFSPTRELADQTYRFCKEFVPYFPDLQVRVLTSGEDKTRTIGKLRSVPHIIIATPGRLHDLALMENAFNPMTATMVVLDEADMLMELGFLDKIDQIVSRLTNPAMSVFSATIPEHLVSFIDRYIAADHRLLLGAKDRNPERITHYALDTRHRDEIEAIMTFLKIVNPYLCLIFASKVTKVQAVYEALQARNVEVGVLHGDLSARERKQMMKRIQLHHFPVVVCSDMAARGLDIEAVSDIVNLDLPNDLSFYFHRAGRTGRYDQKGTCYTFYDHDHLDRINRLLEAGVILNYRSLRDDTLKVEKGPTRVVTTKRKSEPVELSREIRRVVSQTKAKEVKPGYKKKVKLAVEKVKRQHRRKMIRQEIQKQRKREDQGKKHR